MIGERNWTKNSPGLGGTIRPCRGSGGKTTEWPGGGMTGRNGSVMTTVRHGGHGAAQGMHPGRGSGLTSITTECGHGGTLTISCGTDGMLGHGPGEVAVLTNG